MPEEILLHQYAVSPFSEKVRKILAFKRIRWRSVDQPIVAPKPKLVPLTGGYRRIPVLQIGADIYCDTALIARVLEERKPEPKCFPDGNVGACEIVAHWADHWLFMAAVPPGLVERRCRIAAAASSRRWIGWSRSSPVASSSSARRSVSQTPPAFILYGFCTTVLTRSAWYATGPRLHDGSSVSTPWVTVTSRRSTPTTP